MSNVKNSQRHIWDILPANIVICLCLFLSLFGVTLTISLLAPVEYLLTLVIYSALSSWIVSVVAYLGLIRRSP